MLGVGIKNHFNGRVLATLALLCLLLPGRLLFACELMDGKTFSHCCCEQADGKGCTMGGGCDAHEGTVSATTSDACCSVSTEAPSDYTSPSTGNTGSGLGAMVEPSQPPPALLPALPTLLGMQQRVAFAPWQIPAPSPSSVSTTLLVTQRFRI